MNLYILLVDYPKDVLERRSPVRHLHLEYAEELVRQGMLVAGGAFTDNDSPETPPEGALLIYRAENLEAARRLVADDPYFKAGLFDDHRLCRWTATVGSRNIAGS